MRSLLLGVGVAGTLLFFATGAHMRMADPAMVDLPAENRMLYRSRHIYLLLASTVCLVAGIHYRAADGLVRLSIQTVGLLLCTAAIALLFVAFVVEPPRTIEQVHLGRLGVFAVFGGSMLQLVSIVRWPSVRGQL